MKKNYTFISNWKMNFTFKEAIRFATENYDRFVNMAEKTGQKFIVCPSFEVIYSLMQIFKDTEIIIGAQNCSRHSNGSYTGQVSPQSLNSIGCEYCIIGHSEVRKYLNNTNEHVAQKCNHLLDYDITPIICIGESEDEYKNEQTIRILQNQLKPIIKTINSKSNLHEYISPIVAYEPSWSIGTGKVASEDYLNRMFSWIDGHLQKNCPKIEWSLAYGGSLTAENIADIKKVDKINGFLIGKSSIDFQEFEKIVQLALL